MMLTPQQWQRVDAFLRWLEDVMSWALFVALFLVVMLLAAHRLGWVPTKWQ